MPFDSIAASPARSAAGLPANAVILFELSGQSNAWGTNSFESDQPAEARELWQGLENYARIWSRIKAGALAVDPDTLNLGPPASGQTAIDQWLSAPMQAAPNSACQDQQQGRRP